MNSIYIARAARFICTVFLIVLALITFYYISAVAYPFLIAFTIAFLINPAVNFLQKKGRMPRAVAVLFTLLLLFALLAGLVTLLVAEIVSGATYLAAVLPSHLNTLLRFSENWFASQVIPLYNQITGMFNDLDAGQQETILKNIQSAGQKFGTTVGDFLQSFFGNIPAILGWFPNAATVLIFSFLATFFISKDWYRLTAIGGRFIPGKAWTSSRTVFTDLKRALFGFVKAQLTLISITTVIILIGLLFLRVDYAITIALVAGLVDIIPYLGTGAVFVPWILYEIISGDIRLAIGLGVLYTIVLVQRQVMEPKILSTNIGLDPLATLIALFVGFKLLGFLGLIAGPVILVIGNTLKKANVFTDLWMFIKGTESNK
ncbi:sporulation integral membrane protein YtvI [Bacillus sp. FJAT-27225]|uniref:sporulation integral membrane protein YtvI n=1 Tax=Bacillus sp. FJAT-27225 TaxID=1743144 RepID=UPI00080C2E5E|nr:sporulation integral membrane protein YtvI [Bacillus sp. FJAT-27225]OCA91364.1 sporulation integral membrane protein YtvI [Bacillus sp. FJAT-27225]